MIISLFFCDFDCTHTQIIVDMRATRYYLDIIIHNSSIDIFKWTFLLYGAFDNLFFCDNTS